MSGYDIEVRLLAVTPDAEKLIESAGRLCWDTQDKTGTVPDRIQKWIEIGHETMVEHASASFYIRCSRVVTHELVRHRIASYSQRSQRYVNENESKFINPPGLSKFACPNYTAQDLFENAMEACWDQYCQMLKLGVSREIARYVLPNACETQIICTWNFREIRHIIKLRTSKRALPEMRAVAGEIRRIAKNIAPQVFQDL